MNLKQAFNVFLRNGYTIIIDWHGNIWKTRDAIKEFWDKDINRPEGWENWSLSNFKVDDTQIIQDCKHTENNVCFHAINKDPDNLKKLFN